MAVKTVSMVVIAEERCKGCGLCAYNCAQSVIVIAKDKLNSKGYHPAEIVDQESCTGCANCARTCPDVAITVMKE